MNFSKRQKVALIFSIWMFFLWIVAISLVMRVDFQGDLYDCIKISIIGMLLAVVLYVLVFADKYLVAKRMREEEDRKKIKSMKRNAYIALIYVDIVGFFFMTLLALLVDSDKVKFSPSGFIAILTIVALFVTVFIGLRKIHIASRTMILQEQNKEVSQREYR